MFILSGIKFISTYPHPLHWHRHVHFHCHHLQLYYRILIYTVIRSSFGQLARIKSHGGSNGRFVCIDGGTGCISPPIHSRENRAPNQRNHWVFNRLYQPPHFWPECTAFARSTATKRKSVALFLHHIICSLSLFRCHYFCIIYPIYAGCISPIYA